MISPRRFRFCRFGHASIDRKPVKNGPLRRVTTTVIPAKAGMTLSGDGDGPHRFGLRNVGGLAAALTPLFSADYD